MKAIVGEFNLKADLAQIVSADNTTPLAPIELSELGSLPGVLAYLLPDFLDRSKLSMINAELDRQQWLAVGQDGIMSNYHPGDPIGSYRASAFAPDLADAFYQKLSGILPAQRNHQDNSPTDWQPHHLWKPLACNPLLRFIEYRQSGLLCPHYDAPYIKDERSRTLTSLVIYLDHSPNLKGGNTRFLHDPQTRLPLEERDYRDWTHTARDEDILLSVAPTPGSALLFDHRLLHDSQAVISREVGLRKRIIRTDILWQRVD